MKQDFKPSDEQIEILDTARQRGPSMELEAYAGCAKSTTLELLGKDIKIPTLVTAFGNRNVKDLGPRFPQSNFTVKTFNSLGQGAWVRTLPGSARVELDDRKLGRLTTDVAKRFGVEITSDQWGQIRETARKAQLAGLVPKALGLPGLCEDSDFNWTELALEAGASTAETEMTVALAQQVLDDSIVEAKRGKISFLDQLYMPTLFGGKFGQWPVVMVDEVQDLDPLMRQLVSRCLRVDTRMFVAGDRKQGIFAWRGAGADAVDRIRDLRPDWTAKPLHTTFRCPKVIVARQKDHALGFVAAQDAPQGAVHWLARGMGETWDWEAVTRLANALPGTPGITILCRNNAPLLSLAFALLRNSIPVTMLGRDIGKGLATTARKITSGGAAVPIDVFEAKLGEWQITESSKAMANGHDSAADLIHDKAEGLRAIISGSGAKDVQQLIAAIEMIFREVEDGGRGGMVQLSTIHRFKGLEDDIVVHLDPWRLPSKRAREVGGVALAQERNLQYVCETRTRNVLVHGNSDSFI